MYLLFVPLLEFVFVSNFILSVYLCLCTIFVYSAILGKPYKSTVISNNNNNNNIYIVQTGWMIICDHMLTLIFLIVYYDSQTSSISSVHSLPHDCAV